MWGLRKAPVTWCSRGSRDAEGVVPQMATCTVLRRWTSPLAYSIFLGFSPLLAADHGPLLVLSGEAVIAKDRGMLRSGEGALVPAATVVVGLDRLPGARRGQTLGA